jgi:hypothetical protein
MHVQYVSDISRSIKGALAPGVTTLEGLLSYMQKTNHPIDLKPSLDRLQLSIDALGISDPSVYL